MGMTAWRTRYTKRLDHPDILTTRQHFYSASVLFQNCVLLTIKHLNSTHHSRAADGSYTGHDLVPSDVRLSNASPFHPF